MKFPRLTRRRFLRTAFYGAPVLAAADGFGVEPEWVKVKTIRLKPGTAKRRCVHFTDLHYQGDADYLKAVVARINALAPDWVCFTGDIIEQEKHLAEALQILGGIKSPLYGIPGNHDHWSGADFKPVTEAFARTGGGWLEDRQVLTQDGAVSLTGIDQLPLRLAPVPGKTNILLMHYPQWVEELGVARFDLILAGHSHGGQVRLPFYGALLVPFSTGKYEVGMFTTRAGPLYVNPGIGTFFLPVRFNCRPEITVFEL